MLITRLSLSTNRDDDLLTKHVFDARVAINKDPKIGLYVNIGGAYENFIILLEQLETIVSERLASSELRDLINSGCLLPDYWRGKPSLLDEIGEKVKIGINTSVAAHIYAIDKEIRTVINPDWNLAWCYPHYVKKAIPAVPGIYFAVANGAIQYIGQSVNVRNRAGSMHHEALGYRIYVLGVLTGDFDRIDLEKELILKFRPPRNSNFSLPSMSQLIS